MERIWVWLKCKTITKAIEALLKAGDDEHEKARHSSGALANEHRAEAEEFHAAKADLWAAQHKQEQPMKNCSNDSVYDNKAPVQITRLNLTKEAQSYILATVTALALGTVVYLDLELREAHSKLDEAYKDIKTQVWVKQDKEEEKFQKFVAGPYAQLAGELKANEILFSKCKESRK